MTANNPAGEDEPPYMTADFEPTTLEEALYALAFSVGMIGLGADHKPAWRHAKKAAAIIREQSNSSLRDDFAGQALASATRPAGTYDADDIATMCYNIADAMLRAREAKP